MVSNMTTDPQSEENAPETPPEPPPAPVTASEADFRRMVAAGRRKVKNGQTLTNQESAAVKKADRAQEEGLRWKYYATIPKKHWEKMSGRHRGQLTEQADRYDIPFGGAVIDLTKVVPDLHKFLAANALKLAKPDDPLMAGGDSPMLEKYREEQYLMAKLKRGEMERTLIPRDETRMCMGRMASILRNCGEVLQRQFGPGALDVLNEALDDAEGEVNRCLGELETKAENSSNEKPTPTTEG
jgi:hypothetical protein